MAPALLTHLLSRADGSATFTTPLYTILAGVNGPVEVSRRDELPDSAFLEVNIRPSAGVGGPRERWLESILTPLFRSVMLTHQHPRTLIQITLQVLAEPEGPLRRNVSDVTILPALVNAAVAAVVDAALPLDTLLVAGLAVVDRKGKVMLEPESEREFREVGSVHAMAFTSAGEVALEECAGQFEMDVWASVVDGLKKSCLAAIAPRGDDEAMEGADEAAAPWLREALEESVRKNGAWREQG